MIFNRSHVTVRNCASALLLPVDSLQAYIGWLLSYLSSVDELLAVDSLSLTDVDVSDHR